jgi:DNA-binding CsgD family transcriptional regulator
VADADLALLTEAEKQVLRIFLRTTDPKLIAIEIGRSPDAVRDRLKSARRKLNVNRTADAAFRLAAAEGSTHQVVVPPSSGGVQVLPYDLIEGSVERAGFARRLFPRRGRPWNAEPAGPRMMAIAAGVVLLVIAAILCVSLAEAISRIARHGG